jgi:oxygen-independent coproporphyrinogen-3 oxidase
MPASELAAILEACSRNFDLQPGAEITLEANPGTVTLASLQAMRQAGFNRISLGMQSASAIDLMLLERQHDTGDVIRAVEWARLAGFDNLNLDLIYGLPAQPLDRWQESLETALRLQPEHLSLYALSIEHGTPFRRWLERGLIEAPDDDLAADMFDWACDRLERAGYAHYEVSNWARQSAENSLASRHNLQYWRNLPYLGFGPGAHGYAAGKRTAVAGPIPKYIERMNGAGSFGFPSTPATQTITPIDSQNEMEETMMVGLRLLEEGVSAGAFATRFGRPLGEVFGEPIERLRRKGLLEWSADGDRLRLTPRGHLLGNQVFMEFVG